MSLLGLLQATWLPIADQNQNTRRRRAKQQLLVVAVTLSRVTLASVVIELNLVY